MLRLSEFIGGRQERNIMATCQLCGGVIGRDCFNQEEYAWIGYQQEMAAQQKAEEAHHSIQQLNGAIVLRCSACRLPQPTMENCFECFASKLQSTTAPV